MSVFDSRWEASEACELDRSPRATRMAGLESEQQMYRGTLQTPTRSWRRITLDDPDWSLRRATGRLCADSTASATKIRAFPMREFARIDRVIVSPKSGEDSREGAHCQNCVHCQRNG
jgi:hypothetical protein